MRRLSRKSKNKGGPERHPYETVGVRPEDVAGLTESSPRAFFSEGGGTRPSVHICGENPGALHVVDRDLRIMAINEAFEQWNRELGLDTVSFR